MDDDDAIAAVLGGDVDAFEALVKRYERPVFAIVRGHGADGEAEDIAQDVFLKAYRALRSFDPRRGRFASWLYAIARNCCRDLGRRRQPVPGTLEPDAREALGLPDAPTTRLEAALRCLPVERRLAFLLTEVHGLSQADAAEIEGVAIGTIKSRLSRAKEALREILQPEMESDG